MIDRITQLMEEKKLSATQFSDEIGIQRSSLSHVLSGRNKPSLDFMLKIKNRFPEIDLEWLLLGTGQMFSERESEYGSNKKNNVAEPVISTFSSSKHVTGYHPSDERVERHEQESKQDDKTISGKISAEKQKEPVRIIVLYNDSTFETYKNREE
jgi:transcriptional regulator with XRE-family HTH domain